MFEDINTNINENIINKLKDNFYFNEIQDTLLLCEDGLYKIINDQIYKFSLVEQNEIHKIPFKNTFLIKQNKPFKKNKYSENWISPNHEILHTKNLVFKYGEKGNTELHLIFNDKHLIDLFILSKLDEKQYSFQEDLELFYKLIQ